MYILQCKKKIKNGFCLASQGSEVFKTIFYHYMEFVQVNLASDIDMQFNQLAFRWSMGVLLRFSSQNCLNISERFLMLVVISHHFSSHNSLNISERFLVLVVISPFPYYIPFYVEIYLYRNED